MQLERSLGSAEREGLDHLRNLPWYDVRGYADHALRAHRHERQCQRIIAAHNYEAWPQLRSQLTHTIATSAGFFNPDDRFASLSQSFHRVHADFNPAPARNAIEHER